MSFAVFLEPNDSLKKEIIFWKKTINEKYTDSPYNTHPPHSTVINLDVINHINAVNDIKKSLHGFKPFDIIVNHKDVFWNDKITGGHTIYYSIKKNDSLISFQKVIAESLINHKIDIPAPDFISNDKLLYNSHKTYGFPFVGSHWLPHFTVASLMTSKQDKLIKKFLANIKLEKFKVNDFSIWKIKGDEHKKIETVSLS